MSSLSLLQMAGLSGLGALLAAGAFLLTIPLQAHFQAAGWAFRLGFVLPPLFGGAVLTFVSETQLRRGMKEGRWAPQEIASLEGFLGSAGAKASIYVCFLLFLGGLLFDHSFRVVGWAAFILCQALIRLQMIVSPRKEAAANERITPSWQALPAIRSEHWGER